MTDFTVANALWIVRIPARAIRIIAVTLPALVDHVSAETHVVIYKVAGDLLAILKVAYKLIPLVTVVIGRGVAGVTLWAGVGIKTFSRVD
jgi:hypothetical protein